MQLITEDDGFRGVSWGYPRHFALCFGCGLALRAPKKGEQQSRTAEESAGQPRHHPVAVPVPVPVSVEYNLAV